MSWEAVEATEASLDAAERKQLEQLTSTDLFREALREATITYIMIHEVFQVRIPTASITELKEIAVLMRQLAEALKAIGELWKYYYELVGSEGKTG